MVTVSSPNWTGTMLIFGALGCLSRHHATNSPMVNLKVSTDRPLMGDAVRVILSTILFHRILGPVHPKVLETLGVTYTVPDSGTLQQELDEKLAALRGALKNRDNAIVTLRFFDPSSRKAWFNWANDACWEEWVIRCNLDNGDILMIQQDLNELILKIIQVMDRQKEHIPPVTSKDMIPFPYEIRVS